MSFPYPLFALVSLIDVFHVSKIRSSYFMLELIEFVRVSFLGLDGSGGMEALWLLSYLWLNLASRFLRGYSSSSGSTFEGFSLLGVCNLDCL
jgi:hypothetical protein